MNNIEAAEHKLLATWAADCAEHALARFESTQPQDDRPRKAIAATRAWVKGKLRMTEVRTYAFSAHAAAREAKSPASKAAARAAGHAAATAHVATHAKYAAFYALKASDDPDIEKAWQWQQLPKQLHAVLLSEKSKKLSAGNCIVP